MNSGEFVTLRDYFEKLMQQHAEQHTREHAAALVADRQHELRHEAMNEIRDQLREQALRFVSSDSFTGWVQRVESLERAQSRQAGIWVSVTVLVGIASSIITGLIVSGLR